MQSVIKRFVCDSINKNKGEIFELSKKIWENPELGFEEYSASQLYMDYLSGKGFKVEAQVAGMPTAFVATFGQGKPVIGFSAEYDALPGLSQKVADHKEPVIEGAPGHGCGHNLLGAGAVLAAVSVKNAITEFGMKGTVKVFGTPAEEICTGKVVMGRAGLFKGVDIFLDWHPWFETVAQYVSCPAYFNMKYHFKGRTSHGLTPWHGRSALDAALLQGHALEMLREHIDPGEGAVASINYTFSDTGPEAVNIVPDRATLWCVGRVTTSEQLVDTIDRVDKCAEGAALATGTTVEKEYITATHEYMPNKVTAKVLYDNLIEVGNVEFTQEEIEFVMNMQEAQGQKPFWRPDIAPFGNGKAGVSDAAEYSWVAPYATIAVSLGTGPSWHSWTVTACAGGSHGRKTLTKAGQVLALSAADFLLDENLVEKAQAEWKERMAGRQYQCLLPEGTKIPLDFNKKNMNKYR